MTYFPSKAMALVACLGLQRQGTIPVHIASPARTQMMDWLIRPIRANLFADEQAFLWVKKKLDLREYQMAARVWLKSLIIGLLIDSFLF